MKLWSIVGNLGLAGLFSLLPLASSAGDDTVTDNSAVTARFDDGKLPASWRVESGTWQVVDGALEGESKRGEARLIIAAGAWEHFAVEADAQFSWTAEESRWLAINFAGGTGGANRYHSLAVRRDVAARNGLEHAVRRADGSWGVRVARPSPRRIDTGARFSLRVEVTSGRVRAFLNEELALESCFAQDARPGRVALQLSRARVLFDNVRIRPLAPRRATEFVPLDPTRAPVVIAHRGASATAPENTLAAFVLAIEKGAHACEFDVHRTADNELVCFHDRDVRRTTDFVKVFPGRQASASQIENLKLSELAKLNAGTWRSEAFAGEKIPTLQEALEAMRGRITPVIEIKSAGIGKAVAEVVRELGMEREVFVQSFKPAEIAGFRTVLPEVPAGLLLRSDGPVDGVERAREFMEKARKVGASAVVSHYSSISPEFTRELHRRAMTCWVYTVNDSSIVAMLRRMGTDGIITDVPGDVLEQLRRAPEIERAARKARAIQHEHFTTAATISAGRIELLEFARYYGDAVGLPVIMSSPERAARTTIVVPAAIENAGPEVIKAILQKHGWQVRERRLRNGRRVVALEPVAASSRPEEPASRPIVRVEQDNRSSAAAGRPVVAEAPPGEASRTEFGGLTLSRVPDVVSRHLRLQRGGVLVVGVKKGQARHPSLRALERHDVITRVGPRPVRTPLELIRALRKPAKRSELRIMRDGATWIVETTGRRGSRR